MLGTNSNFGCRQEWKMWISGALFEQMRFSFGNLTHVVFWTKAEHFYKNPSERSVLKSQFQSPRNLVEKNLIFHHSSKNNSKFGTKNRLNTLSQQLLRGIIRGTNKIYTFFISNAFFNSPSVLLNFLINWYSNVA